MLLCILHKIIHLLHKVVFKMVEVENASCKINMCIKYMSLTNFDLHRLCKRMDLPIVGVFSKDELEPIPHQIGTYYINMSDAHEAGTHFVCFKIVCDEDRDNYKGKKIKIKYVKQYILIVLELTCRLKCPLI